MWPVVNLIFSVAMLTLILVIQLVHYPSFMYYDVDQFNAGMEAHQQRISWIVIPLMFAEGAAALILAYLDFALFPLLNLSLVLAIWLITFTIQVPLHKKLTRGKNPEAIKLLVRGNWWRVGTWGIKTAVTIMICAFS